MANNKPTFSKQSVHTHFLVLAVSWWVGSVLCIISEVLPDTLYLLLGLIWVPATIVATVFWCILLYRQWFLLQGHGGRVDPGKAVGFGFIPFYCFYWWFVAYAGLATDTNNYLRNAGIKSVRMSFELAVTYCILGILGWTIGLVPMIGNVLILASTIVGFILVIQQRDCVLAIIEEREEKPQPAESENG